MALLNMINNCSDEELDSIIENALNQLITDSEKTIVLGFGDNSQVITTHKGLIAPSTRIRYSMSMNSYSMRTTDYYYEFARYLKEHNVKSTGNLIRVIESFLNQYFGMVKSPQDLRDEYFNQLTWECTSTDEEYFAQLEALQIGDLKGKNMAMCTERAAIAQNILSLFGIESYYCMGCINDNGQVEPHCFNIAKSKSSFVVLDYSKPCHVVFASKIVDYVPFQGKINIDELENVLKNGQQLSFDSYEYVYTPEEMKKVLTGSTRTYIVGSFNFEKEQKPTF